MIIPTYNRKELLVEAIRSVLDQDLPDFEVVVVDDGSTDGSAEEAALLDPRVRVLRQANARRGRARNRGLQTANGDYVAFLDDDDRFEPWHLSQAVARLRAGAEGVSAPTALWDATTGKTRDVTPARSVWKDPAEAALDGMVFPLQSLVVPAQRAIACGGFPDDISLDGSEDLVFLIRLTAVCRLESVARRSVLIREHGTRGMKNGDYIVESRRAATALLLEEGRGGHALSDPEAVRLKAGCHRFCAVMHYEMGRMHEARNELRAARGLLGPVAGWRRTGALTLQTHLGGSVLRVARRLKRALVWR